MRCDSCRKNEATKAVIDGTVCDDCYINTYSCCTSCYEVHPNVAIIFHLPSSPICTGCYDGSQYKLNQEEK
jgi:hypothetical protein